MSYETEKKELTVYLLDNLPSLRVDWENAPHAEPARPYLRPYIVNAEPEQFSMRNDSIEYPAIFSIDIVGNEGEGVNALNAIVDQVVDLFTDVEIGTNIRTAHAYKTRLGADGGRYTVNVTIPFVRVKYRS